MGSRRTLILIAAVVIGLVAAYSLYNYVNGVEDRAYQGAEMVQVLVVKQAIPKTTDGDSAIRQKLIAPDEIPREFLPSSAVTDPTVISGKVALIDLKPGQILVDGLFVSQEQASLTFSDRIPVDQVAVTVQVDQVRGVAGLLVPGDRVNLMIIPAGATLVLDPSLNADGADQPSEPGSGEDAGVVENPAFAKYLYQNVEVLAIGQTAASNPGEAAAANPGSGLITFAVPPDAAQRIALGAASGTLYLTLAPANYQPVDLPAITAENFFDTGRLTPYPTGG